MEESPYFCLYFNDGESSYLSSIIPPMKVDGYIYDKLMKEIKLVLKHQTRVVKGTASFYCYANEGMWLETSCIKRGDHEEMIYLADWDWMVDWALDNKDDVDPSLTPKEIMDLVINKFKCDLGYQEIIDMFINPYSGEEYSIGLGYIPPTIYAILKHLKDIDGKYDPNVIFQFPKLDGRAFRPPTLD